MKRAIYKSEFNQEMIKINLSLVLLCECGLLDSLLIRHVQLKVAHLHYYDEIINISV